MIAKPAGLRLGYNQNWIFKTSTSYLNIAASTQLTLQATFLLERYLVKRRLRSIGILYSHNVCIRRGNHLTIKLFIFDGRLADMLIHFFKHELRDWLIRDLTKKARLSFFLFNLALDRVEKAVSTPRSPTS